MRQERFPKHYIYVHQTEHHCLQQHTNPIRAQIYVLLTFCIPVSRHNTTVRFVLPFGHLRFGSQMLQTPQAKRKTTDSLTPLARAYPQAVYTRKQCALSVTSDDCIYACTFCIYKLRKLKKLFTLVKQLMEATRVFSSSVTNSGTIT